MTTGTNLQLTYDENNDSWSYQNVDYEYPASSTNSWSGYTTADPEFKYAPSEDQDQEQDNDSVCPPGYIYDTTLLQCVPDPNYQAPSWAAERGGIDDDRRDEPTRVEFDASTPEGRKAMYDHGLSHGYFTTDTSKGGAYEFQGPKETGMKLFGLQGLAQFGEDREYERYINELAKEDAKRKAAGQTPILAQAVGFFGLAKSFKNWGSYAMDVASNINTDTTTGFQEVTKPDISGPIDYPWAGSPGTTVPLPQAPPSILAEERKQEIHTEKVNQEKEKTKQQKIKTDKEIDEATGKFSGGKTDRQIDRDTGKFSGSPHSSQGGSFSDTATGKKSGSPKSEPKRRFSPAGGPRPEDRI